MNFQYFCFCFFASRIFVNGLPYEPEESPPNLDLNNFQPQPMIPSQSEENSLPLEGDIGQQPPNQNGKPSDEKNSNLPPSDIKGPNDSDQRTHKGRLPPIPVSAPIPGQAANKKTIKTGEQKSGIKELLTPTSRVPEKTRNPGKDEPSYRKLDDAENPDLKPAKVTKLDIIGHGSGIKSKKLVNAQPIKSVGTPETNQAEAKGQRSGTKPEDIVNYGQMNGVANPETKDQGSGAKPEEIANHKPMNGLANPETKDQRSGTKPGEKANNKQINSLENPETKDQGSGTKPKEMTNYGRGNGVANPGTKDQRSGIKDQRLGPKPEEIANPKQMNGLANPETKDQISGTKLKEMKNYGQGNGVANPAGIKQEKSAVDKEINRKEIPKTNRITFDQKEPTVLQREEENAKDKMKRPVIIEINDYQDQGNSHFFVYFVSIVVLCIISYVVFHNKKKLIALMVEGRQGYRPRRRSMNKNYQRLENVDDVLPDIKTSSSSTTNVIY